MIKLLESGKDNQLFNDALDAYLTNSDHVKAGYEPSSRPEWVNGHKELFASNLGSDYVVAADITDNIIVGMAIGYRNDVIIGRAGKNILTGWHLALVWKHERHWAAPKDYIFSVTNPISTYMEKHGIFEFTKVIRFSEANARRVGLHKYLEIAYNKNIPDSRYNPYIESTVRNNDELQRLPLLWRKFYPDNIITPLMTVKHSLKNEIRQQYLMNDVQ